MKNRSWLPIATFLTCALTCVASEAIRIFGWYNRFGPFNEDNTFLEIAVGNWGLGSLGPYALVFLPFAVVVCNPNSLKIRIGWFLFSLVVLVVSWLEAPGAVQGRWGNSTGQNFGLFYQFIVPIPAMVFLVIGIRSTISQRRRRTDDREPG